jgi:hypothetical protein
MNVLNNINNSFESYQQLVSLYETNRGKHFFSVIHIELRDWFIEKNKGKMQIISDSGFYEFGTEGNTYKLFNGQFPGTIVNLQFRTDDNCNYALMSEKDINNIF